MDCVTMLTVVWLKITQLWQIIEATEPSRYAVEFYDTPFRCCRKKTLCGCRGGGKQSAPTLGFVDYFFCNRLLFRVVLLHSSRIFL